LRDSKRLSVVPLEDRCLPAIDFAAVANGLASTAESAAHLVSDAYQRDLGRAADAGGLATCTGLLQQGWTPQQLDGFLAGSPEYVNAHGGPGANFIRGLYNDLLGREPDAGGSAAWVNSLAHGATPAAVANALAMSPERGGRVVSADYAQFLGRAPDPAAVSYWASQLASGLDGRRLEAALAASPEYQGRTGSDAGWVGATYQNLFGRAATAADVQFWTTPPPAPAPTAAAQAQAYSEVIQQQSPTCFFAASLAAAVNSGANLAGRITYLGNNTFNVPLYNPQVNQYYQVTGFGPVLNVQVYFDGSTNPAVDLAVPPDGHPWAVLYQRAYNQVFGQSPTGGSAAFALMTLTGQANYSIPGANWAFGAKTPSSAADYNEIVNALNQGKPIVADTKGGGNYVLDPSTGLIGYHSYAVVGADSGYVTLYNPWGVDTDWRTLDTNQNGQLDASEAQHSPDGLNGNFYDGLLRVSWATFQTYFNTVAIAAHTA
jgi:hypothetical protein